MNTKSFLEALPASVSDSWQRLAVSESNPHIQFLFQAFEVSTAEMRRLGDDIHGRTLVEKALAQADELVLRFRRLPDSTKTQRFTPASMEAPAPPLEEEGSDEASIVKEYKRAAEGRRFVAIKWFRDAWIPSTSLPWRTDAQRVRQALATAIEKGLLRKEQIPNPNNPDHPTTVLKEGVAAGAAPQLRSRWSNPIEIKGKPLSQTVIEGR
jgi:hypothetical protein